MFPHGNLFFVISFFSSVHAGFRSFALILHHIPISEQQRDTPQSSRTHQRIIRHDGKIIDNAMLSIISIVADRDIPAKIRIAGKGIKVPNHAIVRDQYMIPQEISATHLRVRIHQTFFKQNISFSHLIRMNTAI